MNPLHKSLPILSRFLIVNAAIAFAHPAFCQTGAPDNAKGLLDKAKQSEYERKMSLKQTELDRLSEDMKKAKEQAESLQKLVDSVDTAIVEATGHLDRVTGQRNHQPKVAEVIGLKFEAQRMRVDGLKMLKAAQAKALDAVNKHNEVLDLKTTLGAVEMKAFAEKALSGGADSAPLIGDAAKKDKALPGSEVRKNLATAEKDAALVETAAREAMQAATQKLQQADAAAEKAEKRRMDLGVEDITSLPVDREGLDTPAVVAPIKARPKR